MTECVHPLGEAGRVEDRHRAALGVPEEHRLLGPCGLHHRRHVAHARLEVGQGARPVRHPGPALVEPDEARERAEAVQEVRVPPFGPVEHEVRDEAGHQDQVDVARAGDLVGDVEVVAVGVPDRRRGVGGDRGCLRRFTRQVGPAVVRRRQLCQLLAAGHVELAQQRRHVALDGPHGDDEAVRDLGVAEMRRDQTQHLGLAIGDAGLRQGPWLHHPTIVEPRASVVNP